ncbi:hypothetical protein IE53DRAFT_372842 [Violaceomyces palustris]|uniref:Uncharacterized protein n=1 Tax=Violaceomyces palustris TaxID=1673888 RepID=A0ACD0P704_9BASI|nr:hypothetical protein IE53DRAFT_372842 [Violaceomyces palustris]
MPQNSFAQQLSHQTALQDGSSSITSSIPTQLFQGSASHQIPFNPSPVQHGPSLLGFGFGFGTSFGGNNNNSTLTQNQSHGHQLKLNNVTVAPSTSASTSPSSSFGLVSHGSSTPLVPAPRRLEGKRRREDEDEGIDSTGDEDMEQGDQTSSSPIRPRHSPSQPKFPHANESSNDGRRQLIPKRLRAGTSLVVGSGPTSLSFNSASAAHISQGCASRLSSLPKDKETKPSDENISTKVAGLDMDLGKMLASLDRTSLLTLITNLISTSTDPSLGAQILSLLPSPSLESVEALLDELERGIRSAIPVASNGATVREEYAWSRLRGPVAELSTSALSYFPFFVSETSDGLSARDKATSPHSDQRAREEVHPSTTFSFLHALTSRILRIEQNLPPVPRNLVNHGQRIPGFVADSVSLNSPVSASETRGMVHPATRFPHDLLIRHIPSHLTSPNSPDTLFTILIPALLKQWTILLERLDRAVNLDGRMFSQEVVLGWARSLESLCSNGCSRTGKLQGTSIKDEESAIRMSMDETRRRLERDLGWLVGGTGSVPNSRTLSLKWEKTTSPRHLNAVMDEADEEEL